MSAVDPQKALKNNNTTAFLTALAVNAVLLAVEVGAFLVLKQRLWRIYSPRTVLPPLDKRAEKLPSGPWKWIPALITSPPEQIIHQNGLDAYMFLRYIRLLIIIFGVFTLTTFAIVVPVNSVNVQTDHVGLDRISWSNITDPKDQPRFSAHVAVVYILTGFVLWMIQKEMRGFIHLRHQFLISKSHSRLAQARTVLISPVPDDLASEKDLRTFASFVPGGIDRIWLYRDTKSLNELFEKRQEACERLEAAISEILKIATLAWKKKVKAHKKQLKRHSDPEANGPLLEQPPPSQRLLDELVPVSKRPTHRTSLLGLVGTKVDSFNWCKDEIANLNKDIEDKRKHIEKGKFLGSAFVRCNLQLGAHVLAQCYSYHEPLKMYNKWMEAHPKDVVWRNLDDGALEMKSRKVLSWVATAGLIFVWAFPVTFIGTLSNVSDLCDKIHWLQFTCDAPKLVRGLIEGVLPPLLLAIMFALLPFILKGLAWYECIPRYSLISVSVYRRFYIFLLIHGFLIVTLSAGITEAIEDIIRNPTQTVQQLSSQLPNASVFFLTYMVTQGLAGAGSALVQLAPLLLHYLRKWFLGRTPRQAFDVTFRMPAADFGTTLPRLSLLATIALAYSVLAPLINVLAFLSYGMFYLAWKFLFTQVFDQPDEVETGGMYFPMAINNLFVGLYIEQICLACLFLLKVQNAGVTAIVEAAFMIVLIVLTASVHSFIHNMYNPMKTYLPMSLATKKMAQRFAKQNEKISDDEGDIDLFSRDRVRSVRRRLKSKAKALDAKLEDLKIKVKAELDPKSREEKRRSDESKRSVASGSSTPVIAPAAVALRDSDSEDESDHDEHAFDHPSMYVDQAWIWVPEDPLKLSKFLVEELKKVGVSASDLGATMDEDGVVNVTRNPPDEDWGGGHDS